MHDDIFIDIRDDKINDHTKQLKGKNPDVFKSTILNKSHRKNETPCLKISTKAS